MITLARMMGKGRKGVYRFAGLPLGFLAGGTERDTEIISLTIEEIDQLSAISHYESSVEYLRQNHLKDSLTQLQFALNEARNKFPWSINLHSCLMNRMSILQKLLNQRKEFESLLQELYLVSLSSKGSKSLDTIKHLVNYLTCLTIHNPKKCNNVISFLAEEEPLPEYALFFDALNDIREKQEYASGLGKLGKLPEGLPVEKVFKYNNLAYMRVFSLKHGRHINDYLKDLKPQSQDVLSSYIQALLVAESNPQQLKNFTQQQTAAAQRLQMDLNAYLSKKSKTLPVDKLSPKRILKHFNSHIISMNIASLLFDLQRIDECSFFLKLTLEKAISDNELQRVGIALNLLGRCYYLQGDEKWEQTYLDILEHTDTYPVVVIKQALATYSKLLFQQGRTYEAEAYLHQSLSLEGENDIEGLILPSYDFSF